MRVVERSSPSPKRSSARNGWVAIEAKPLGRACRPASGYCCRQACWPPRRKLGALEVQLANSVLRQHLLTHHHEVAQRLVRRKIRGIAKYLLPRQRLVQRQRLGLRRPYQPPVWPYQEAKLHNQSYAPNLLCPWQNPNTHTLMSMHRGEHP